MCLKLQHLHTAFIPQEVEFANLDSGLCTISQFWNRRAEFCLLQAHPRALATPRDHRHGTYFKITRDSESERQHGTSQTLLHPVNCRILNASRPNYEFNGPIRGRHGIRQPI